MLFRKIQAWRHAEKKEIRKSLFAIICGFHESISRSIWRVLLPRKIEQERRHKHMALYAFASRLLNTHEPIHRANLFSHSRIPRLLFALRHRVVRLRSMKSGRRDLFGSCCVHTWWVEIVGAPVGLWIKPTRILYQITIWRSRINIDPRTTS